MAQTDIVRAIEARLTELDAELLRLEELATERDTLRNTLRVLTLGKAAPTVTSYADEKPSLPRRKRYEVTPSILKLLSLEPGLTSPQIADKLERVIVTARRDPRRAIVARISELLDSKQIRRAHDGRLYLVTASEQTEVQENKEGK
jgi:hypothetical protein